MSQEHRIVHPVDVHMHCVCDFTSLRAPDYQIRYEPGTRLYFPLQYCDITREYRQLPRSSH